jgi:hypothetical protein
MSTKAHSLKPGKSTSDRSEVNVWPSDTIERAILERDIRIADIHPNKELDLLVIVLNTRDVVRVPLSAYVRLAKAGTKALANWQLLGEGYGVHWPDLDEHLSLKGFLRDAMMSEFLHQWARPGIARTKRTKVRV